MPLSFDTDEMSQLKHDAAVAVFGRPSLSS